MTESLERHINEDLKGYSVVSPLDAPKIVTCSSDELQAVLTTETWKMASVPMNVALVGMVGSGKSALRNVLGSNRCSFLEVVQARKGTVVLRKSLDKFSPNIMYWDSNGYDPKMETCDEYYAHFTAADVFLVVISCSMSQFDICFIKLALQRGKKAFIIYSKIDKELAYFKQDQKMQYDEQSYLLQVRKRIYAELRSEQICEVPCFFVSPFKREKWDFNALRVRLSVTLVNSKKLSITSNLTRLIKERISLKKPMLEECNETAAKSAAVKCFVSKPMSYLSHVHSLISVQKEFLEHELGIQFHTNTVELAMKKHGLSRVFEVLRCLPILGTVPSSLVTSKTLSGILRQLLNDGIDCAILKWSLMVEDMVKEVVPVCTPWQLQGLDL